MAMDGFCNILIKGSYETMRLTPLEIAIIVGRKTGFPDIDMEPLVEGWKISASTVSGDGRASVIVRGATQEEAVASLVSKLWT